MPSVEILHRVCPACGRDNRNASPYRFSSPEWRLKKCPSCGFLYLENAPAYAALSDERAWEKTSKAESLRREQANGIQQKISKATRLRLKLPRKHVLDFLERYAPDGRVLDIGCGNAGYMLQMAPRHQPCGIEISKEMAAEGARNLAGRGGFVLHASSLEGLRHLPDGDLAAVVMRAYLEHEILPKEILQESFRVLKEGGILVIKVPNYGSINAAVMGKRWCGLRLPDHVNYFTPGSLSEMVRQAGFRILRFGLLSMRQPTSDNMWMIAARPAA